MCFDEVIDVLRLKIPKTPKNLVDLLPDPEYYLDLKGISIPLYGGLISGEVELFNQFTEKVDRITRGFQGILRDIKAPSNYTVEQVINALRVGSIENIKYHFKDVNFSELGFNELNKIAKERGVTFLIETITEGDDSVQKIVEQYYELWIENGYTGSAIVITNEILSETKPIVIDGVEIQKIDSEEVVKRSGLTWEEIEGLPSFLDPLLPYLAIIKFRTGIGSYVVFSFMRPDELVEATMALQEEFETRKLEITPELIHHNENVQIEVQENGSESTENNNKRLGNESNQSTTTVNSRKRKAKKEEDKEI
jgi:hypothetical protein